MKNPSTYLAPTYLSDVVTYDEPAYFQEMIDIEWRGQIQSTTGGRKFKLYYCGTYDEDLALLLDQDDFPVVVYAEDCQTKERILLFDYAKHGYDALFCDEYEEEVLKQREGELQLLHLGGETEFEILVYAYYGIDYDEEMEAFLNDEGQIELISGELISPEDLKRNGFDFFGMDVIDTKGNRQRIVEFELA